jgi:NitT/TauT family transport system substrate-binding protein
MDGSDRFTYRLARLAAGLFFILLVLVGGWVGVGCNKGKDGATGGVEGQPTEVRLGYFANLTHAQAVLGASSGEFEKAVAPSKFSTKVFNAGPSLVEALFAGEIDIGYVGPGPALTAFDKSHGKGLVVVSGAAANGVVIVARSGSGINTLQDLAGHKIASPQHGNTQDISARHYVTAELKRDASSVVPIPNAEHAGMMTRGEIDASWAPEPWGSFLVAQTGAKVIAAERDLWPEKNFAITLVVTTPEFLKKHPDTLEKVLQVHLEWTDRLKGDPQKYLPQLEQALFALTNKRLPAGVLQSALPNVTFTEEPLPNTFVKFAQWSYDLGFSKEPTDTTGLIDASILKRLRAAGPPPAASSTGPAAPMTKPAGS